MIYRSYKYFKNESFREELIQIEVNRNNCDKSFKNFTFSRNAILNKHAPQKKKYVRRNQSPFMNKTLSKVIMQRSKLRNLFLKKRTEEKEINMLSKGIYMLHFCKKVKENFLEV